MRAFGLLSGLLLCLLLGCSKPAQDQVAPPDNAGHPALWSIEDDAGHKGWLFGTIHALPKGTAWQSETLDTALRDSRMLTIEANGLDDQKAVAQIFAALGVRGGLPPLSERVAPDLRPALKAAVVRSKIPSHTLDKMESWAATLILASAFGADMGLEKGEGVEQVLIRRFKAEEKPISGLETIAGQLGIFDDLPEHEQRTMLNTMLRSGDSNQDRFEVQFTAWHDGAIEKLEQKEGEGILASPLLREKLLDGRNRDWATQIAALLAGDRGAFVAVGAAHLPGKNGVVALLENAGYRLKRLQ